VFDSENRRELQGCIRSLNESGLLAVEGCVKRGGESQRAMNTRAIVLISFLGNIGLLALAFHLKAARSSALSAESSLAVSSASSSTRLAAVETKVEFVTNDVTAEFRWRQVESRDYKAYIANLRTIGCPEETIRDIIAADVTKLYAQKRRALYPDLKPDEYWKKDPSWRGVNSPELERQTKLRALDKEKSALLKELLGIDPIKERQKENGYVDYWDRIYGFLSEEKQQQVRDISDQFDQKIQPLYRMQMRDEDDEKEIRKLLREKLAAMASVLSPQELEQYELRASQIATQMRYDLDGFEPTQQEFQEIYKLRKQREEDLAYVYDQDDNEAQAKRKKAVDEVEEQLKNMLGEQRFAEYKRAQDYSYKELVRLLERDNLPTLLAAKVHEWKTGSEDAVKRIRNDPSLTQEQRNEALQALRAEAEDALTRQLGEKVFSNYRRNGGSWLNNIASPREVRRR
jgi:hypothetical protein